ncbi:MAG: iron transporter ATP-binding protein [Acidimicrobiales bacterium]|nr:iron transporter ATP-binding protein [Acidimicrobiales bacterium]
MVTKGGGARGLDCQAVTVRFGAKVAVDDVSLAVAPGEVVALVGPSGCGKSSLLRVVAGLEVAHAGRISWGGLDVTGQRVDQRGFGLMFQEHALFPHRLVGENVAFGLRMRGDDRAARSARVGEVLELVGLAGFEGRSVETLSGGEAQRVALARALAPAPRLLMLDEPLGSLDRTLRDRLALDLRALLTGLGLAAIHVTHDQEEAYAVADRLVVMAAGRILRDGPAVAVWEDPGSEFVARFLGHDNVVDAPAARSLGLGDGTHAVVVREAALAFDGARPSPSAPGPGRWRATVLDVRFQGATCLVVVRVAPVSGPPVDLAFHTAAPPHPGTSGVLSIDRCQVVRLADPIAP